MSAVRARRRARHKTVLVTGAGGALAQRLIARLYPEHRIVAVDFRQKVRTHADIASYRVAPDHQGFEEIFSRHEIDTVVHLGRMLAPEGDERRRCKANVAGTERLLALCLQHGVRQVLIQSSHLVYGASAHNPALLEEDYPLPPPATNPDLVDLLEVESLAQRHLRAYPKLNVTILRTCNVLGPGVRNTLSTMLSRRYVPVLLGYSPMMQFVHVDDAAEALLLALEKNRRGLYNVAPADWVPYQDAILQCGCRRLPVPSLPPSLPRRLAAPLEGSRYFPSYLIRYLKYPVIIDGGPFAHRFGWRPRHGLNDIFMFYRKQKKILSEARVR